jgi:hypothetical protein
MTSYEVSNGFWVIGYTFHAFYGLFRCLSSRELLSTILEDRMTHFVTLTVPPPCIDHSLRNSTPRVGLRARWFRILHNFRYPGQLFRNLPDFYQIPVDDNLWGFHWFWAIWYKFHAFYGSFRCLSSRELLSTIPGDRMTHFVTLTVPPPRTDHSLRHSTTRVGLQARQFRILWLREKRLFRAVFVTYNTRFSNFMTSRKMSVSGHFRELSHTIFDTRVNFFETSQIFSKSLYMTSYEVSIGFWAIGYTFHAFYGPFHCLSSRELLSTIPEDGMTHFVTLTVPPPRIDHSLRHSTTRVGLRARRFRILWLREKRPFRAIFVSINARFSAPGSSFSKPPEFLRNPCRWHLMRFPLVFEP